MPMSKRLLAEQLLRDLRREADAEKAKVLQGFFKTGPGQYGEGDVFIGVVVPKIRRLVKSYHQLDLSEIKKLLAGPLHEARLAALLILVAQYRDGDAAGREKIFRFYLTQTARINSWDLVDLTAPEIIGAQLSASPDDKLLTRLARSTLLWERRIAIVATFYDIRHGRPKSALRVAKLLLEDEHDLIHKAVGWMLREVGKRCSLADEKKFLDAHASVMPRTMLRYAIERLSAEERQYYMRRGHLVRTIDDRR